MLYILHTMYHLFHFPALLLLLLVRAQRCKGQSGFKCDNVFYGDTTGISIYCYPYPQKNSLPAFCFKDQWWKTLAYASVRGDLGSSTNPYKLLDLQICKKRCRCELLVYADAFTCLDRGRQLAWTDELNLQQRSTMLCKKFRLPAHLEQNAANILFEAVLMNYPIDADYSIPLLGDLIQAFSRINIEGINIAFKHITLSWPAITTLDNFFSEDALQNLSSLTIGGGGIALELIHNATWPSIDYVLQRVTNKLIFFCLNDVNVNAIPRPLFSPNLIFLICIRCFWLKTAPVWLSESKKLQFLHLNNMLPTFVLENLPPSTSLLYFGFADTTLKQWPKTFFLSKWYPNLEYVDLNNLELEFVPAESFIGLHSLSHLDLSGNCLTPLPSFNGLKNLKFLSLSGRHPTARVSSPAFSIQAFLICSTLQGQCSTLRVTQSDLLNFGSLERLHINYYKNLMVDDNAFANLSSLNWLELRCVNIKRLPTSLRYTCQLQKVITDYNPLNQSNALIDPINWSIPLFIPKFYNKLKSISLAVDANYKTIPPTFFFFNYSKDSKLVREFSYYMVISTTLSKNACEMYKLESAYGMQRIASFGFNEKNSSCQQEFLNIKNVGRSAMETLTDYCIHQSWARSVRLDSKYKLGIGGALVFSMIFG